MKHKKRLLLLLMISVMTCAGCGSRDPGEAAPQKPWTEAYQEHSQPREREDQSANQATAASETENPASYEDLLEISTFSGDVTETWETGCKLMPIQYEENIAYSAAPGYETECITVAYQDTCTFQIANVNIQTGAVFYEGANVQNIKEQQSLLICGEYDSSNVLQAQRVFICRFVS